MRDPLLQLISTGLGLWIRSRCDQVERRESMRAYELG